MTQKKIYDCITFFDENLMLEVRFNILNKFVDKFIIVEAKFSHSGEKKKLNFNINKLSEFKKKIIYLTVENEPENIIYQNGYESFFADVMELDLLTKETKIFMNDKTSKVKFLKNNGYN